VLWQLTPATSSPAFLPAADELYDFNLSAGVERGFAPKRLLEDAAIQFYRNAPWVKFQLFEQFQHGLAFGGRPPFAVHGDFDGHALVDTLVLQPL
jgi:hypothetical protein